MYDKVHSLIKKRWDIHEKIESLQFVIDSSTDESDNYKLYQLHKKLDKLDKKILKELKSLVKALE